MDLTNADLWLFILMKKGVLTFEDITKAVDSFKDDQATISDITDVDFPEVIRGKRFNYPKGGRHTLFHEILEDLDSLVAEGYAGRGIEEDGNDFVEIFEITDVGNGRVGSLIVELQGEGFKIVG